MRLPRFKVVLKLISLSWIPLLISAAYAGYVSYNAIPEERSISTFINYFAGGFFFLMWLVGQYLRTAKQIDDSESHEDIRYTLSQLQTSIKEISPKTRAKLSLSNPLLHSADQSVQNGRVLAGLLQAGVAFDDAVINKAKKHSINIDERRSSFGIILEFEPFLSHMVFSDLIQLCRFKNQLTRLTEEEKAEIERQPHLLGNFIWAVTELESDT